MERGSAAEQKVQTEGSKCMRSRELNIDLKTLELFVYIVSRCLSSLRSRLGIWFLLRFLLLISLVPRSRGITTSRFGGFTWRWDRTCRIDGDVLHRADFEIGLVVREKLLPVNKTPEFFIVEAPNIVRQVSLETSRGVRPRGVSSGEDVIRTPRSVCLSILRHVVHISINSDV